MFRILLAVTFVFLARPAVADTMTILALGDSLTAGLGLDPGDAFPVKLEAALKAKGHDVRIINAGVSGDTSAAGRDRLEWALNDGVDAVIIELGANDALRGVSPAETRQALDGILEVLQERGIPAMVAGMLAPRNLGPDYIAAFDPLFGELAAKYDAVFYKFFLDGVAADPHLNQADGIHPNARGVDVIVSRILPSVEQLIVKAGRE
jgi:acyl-CoA thioesterase-1